MYRDVDVTPQEDKMIDMIDQKTHEHRLDMFTIPMIEWLNPLSYIGAQMGPILFAPILLD